MGYLAILIGIILVGAMSYLGFSTNYPISPAQENPLESIAVNLPLEKTFLSINDAVIQVEVAQTQEQHQKGLSGRPSLAPDAGMLFVFGSPGIPHFWMEDMQFPIDIIWIDEDNRVVSTSENLPSNSFPKTFSPTVPILYVLEVNAGFVRMHNVKEGDVVKIGNF